MRIQFFVQEVVLKIVTQVHVLIKTRILSLHAKSFRCEVSSVNLYQYCPDSCKHNNCEKSQNQDFAKKFKHT